MVSIPQIPSPAVLSRIKRIQGITIAWMTVEVAVSLFAAWRARSPALLAFGGDSAVELLSAVVVLWRFHAAIKDRRAERRAAQIAAALLLILATSVTVTSVMTLLGRSESSPSYLGIVILIGAAAIMPWLARQKRRLSDGTGSAALRADAAQSGLCAYLALTALLGIGANAVWHVPWADPLTALAITPFILWEAKEAFEGKSCQCS
jgi:divalent metal cation (Fe/Co/Zn/Cd) transporter